MKKKNKKERRRGLLGVVEAWLWRGGLASGSRGFSGGNGGRCLLLVKEEENCRGEREARWHAHYMRWWGGFLWWIWRCSSWWWRCWWLKAVVERERGGGFAGSRNEGGGLVFSSILNPNLSTHGPWKSNLFIGDERGALCLFWCQFLALGLTWKHLNH
jgi:hypothetical protein